MNYQGFYPTSQYLDSNISNNQGLLSNVQPLQTNYNQGLLSDIQPMQTNYNQGFLSNIQPLQTNYNQGLLSNVQPLQNNYNQGILSDVQPLQNNYYQGLLSNVQPLQTNYNQGFLSNALPLQTNYNQGFLYDGQNTLSYDLSTLNTQNNLINNQAYSFPLPDQNNPYSQYQFSTGNTFASQNYLTSQNYYPSIVTQNINSAIPNSTLQAPVSNLDYNYLSNQVGLKGYSGINYVSGLTGLSNEPSPVYNINAFQGNASTGNIYLDNNYTGKIDAANIYNGQAYSGISQLPDLQTAYLGNIPSSLFSNMTTNYNSNLLNIQPQTAIAGNTNQYMQNLVAPQVFQQSIINLAVPTNPQAGASLMPRVEPAYVIINGKKCIKEPGMSDADFYLKNLGITGQLLNVGTSQLVSKNVISQNFNLANQPISSMIPNNMPQPRINQDISLPSVTGSNLMMGNLMTTKFSDSNKDAKEPEVKLENLNSSKNSVNHEKNTLSKSKEDDKDKVKGDGFFD